jgi:hypothetical protein
MAARTSGGRLVEVWVMSSSRLLARNSILRPVSYILILMQQPDLGVIRSPLAGHWK